MLYDQVFDYLSGMNTAVWIAREDYMPYIYSTDEYGGVLMGWAIGHRDANGFIYTTIVVLYKRNSLNILT